MKTLGRFLVCALILVVIIVAGAYAIGATLPVDHQVGIRAQVNAPPEAVFAKIIDVAHGAEWRPEIKGVQMLPSEDNQDHWVEDVGHGQTMTFLATRTWAPMRRDVLLDQPDASYGGTWTYELAPGPTPNTTTLTITETGFIKPPLYRFVMAHIIGPTRNLDNYMRDIQKAFSH